MSKLSTLKELWEQNGEKPFWAKSDGGSICYITGYNPRETTLWQAWMAEDNKQEMRSIVLEDVKAWQFCDDPTKKPEPLRVWAAMGQVFLGKDPPMKHEKLDPEAKDITADLTRALLPELRRLMEDE